MLIANRGEIAARIAATCQRLGIETVLAASDPDLDSLPARLAGRTVRLGPAPPAASYLDVDAVVAAAMAAGADAVHPGYGFLAENPRLARACEAAGLVFIGPPPAQLELAGDKLAARSLAAAAGLPVLPGGEVSDPGQAVALARRIGWPVLIKAAGGGGGRGMRPAHSPGELAAAAAQAAAEARAAFGDPRIYLERFASPARHVEVQLLGDGKRVIHIGDRDCSLQRRYQKVAEEAPAPGLEPGLRAALREAAVSFGTRLGYRGLGTVEFLVLTGARTSTSTSTSDSDSDSAFYNSAFYFLEMNARIQVEHPVTEAVSGLDLVAEQIAVAEGRPLRLTQADVVLTGHAIECRINAEDWQQDLRPSPGTITRAVFPAGPGVRVDTGVQAGSAVPPSYDSLLAKLIVHGADRAQAVSRLRHALDSCEITGVATNLPMHARLVRDPAFVSGGVATGFLTRFLATSRGDEPGDGRAGDGRAGDGRAGMAAAGG
ncbi:MAG TPA: biotin carboxylase N-terminal domain-containing protein [Streptosporangiaceae bacterium]|nr:biotin carboxylase N-terminal domain-containing protein [Streptosporangiaceae bacterium]